MFANHTKGKVIKSIFYNFGAVVAAAIPDSGNIGTAGDDQTDRHIIGIYTTDHTALARTRLMYNNKPIIDMDDNVISSAAGPLDLDITYPKGVYLDLSMINGSAGTINNSVTIFYEVDKV